MFWVEYEYEMNGQLSNINTFRVTELYEISAKNVESFCYCYILW
ncbi:hypothetical protein Bhyg_01830, partial [Pseudolycoriella hygida]